MTLTMNEKSITKTQNTTTNLSRFTQYELQQKKEAFKATFKKKVEEVSGKKFEVSLPLHNYRALAEMIMEHVNSGLADSNLKYTKHEEREIHFFSIEFLIGQMMRNYIINLGWDDFIYEALDELGIDFESLQVMEHDPALGNGGLGRLMACFLDSGASMGLPIFGNGIRYKYGLFEQKILNNEQVEIADNWLKNGYPFEQAQHDEAVVVKYGGHVQQEMVGDKMVFIHKDYSPILAVPYEIPIQGYHNDTTNYLRLWNAEPVDDFDLTTFNNGNYLQAIERQSEAAAISHILYPSDSGFDGKLLRLKQEYFFVSAGLKHLVSRYKRHHHGSIAHFEEKTCVHINDTHPALCVPELMRILIDEEGLGWDEAWKITTRTLTFTNHTVLPEALEKWPVYMMKDLLPRIFMIIKEIDRRFMEEMNHLYPHFEARNYAMSIIKEDQVHMANLAIIGSSSVNGVAALHSKILREHTFKNYYEVYPHKFNSVTNGVTPRRFMFGNNPKLIDLISDTIGDDFKKSNNLNALKDLEAFEDNAEFQSKIEDIKLENKKRLAEHIAHTQGIHINPYSIFDIQVKRIHEYKRQQLNALHIMHCYNMLKDNPNMDWVPRTFIIAGKAAPSYAFAKEVIRLINTLATKINNDPRMKDRLSVVFMPNFNVSVAEIIYPAAEVSEQISTAGKEASGTGNMKFMMNGAITIGTMDGANVEISQNVGLDNIFTFGLSDITVANYQRNGGYHSIDYFNKDERIQRVLKQLIDENYMETNVFHSIYDSLLIHNDQYFVLADFDDYTKTQHNLSMEYLNRNKWNRMSIHNIANSGFFSSDRSIRDYQKRIWKTYKD